MPRTNKKSLVIPGVVSGLDQPMRLPGLADALTQVDNLLSAALSERQPEDALRLVADLYRMQRIAGQALAMALYKLKQRWSELGMDDAFEDAILKYCGLSRDTVTRWVRVWEFYESHDLDEPLRMKFMERPVADVVAIVQAENAHGEFTASQLKKLANQPDTRTLRTTIGELVGRKQNTGNFLTLRLKRNGTLEALSSNGRQRTSLGMLKTTPHDLEDSFHATALNYLLDELGVLRE